MAEEQSEQTQEQIDAAQVALEDRAKGMGWIPPEDFKGDKSRFTSAEDFVERADSLMPIMKATMGKYEQTIAQQGTQIANLESTVKVQKETTEKLLKMSDNVREQAYLRAKKDIQAQQVIAIKDGDIEGYQALEDQKDALVKPKPDHVDQGQQSGTTDQGAKAGQGEPDPDYKAWLPNNQWYTSDRNMEIFADGVAREYKREHPGMPFAEVLGHITERTKAAFPHKFTNPARSNAGAVDGGSERHNAGDGSGTKTYNHLPADAKVQCDIFIANGDIKDRAAYVKDYPW